MYDDSILNVIKLCGILNSKGLWWKAHENKIRFYQLIMGMQLMHLFSFEYTVKVLLFVGTSFHSLGENNQLMGFQFVDLTTLSTKNGKFPFSWKPNFVVYQTKEINKYWYPMNKILSQYVLWCLWKFFILCMNK